MKKLISILCSLIVMTAVTAGCTQEPSLNVKDAESAVQSATASNGETAVTTEALTERILAPANVDPNANYDYEVREIWCENNGQKIYGEAYVPVTDGKSPLVIHSHGLGANHESGASYGKKYAVRGIAVYTFDFRGGSNSNHENRSDGKTTDMSVLTEASDVTAVLNTAKTWDFVDTDRIFLEGGSQGGLVTAIAGVQHEDEVAGLIMHYPAFAMPDYIRSRYSGGDMPEEFTISSITLGRVFAEDLLSYDVRDDVPGFDKPVLILQGSEDHIVLPSVTEAVSKMYPDSEYHIIEGGEHGFSGEYHDEATKYGLGFIYRVIGIK